MKQYGLFGGTMQFTLMCASVRKALNGAITVTCAHSVAIEIHDFTSF